MRGDAYCCFIIMSILAFQFPISRDERRRGKGVARIEVEVERFLYHCYCLGILAFVQLAVRDTIY